MCIYETNSIKITQNIYKHKIKFAERKKITKRKIVLPYFWDRKCVRGEWEETA
jgi:hypothetical protein